MIKKISRDHGLVEYRMRDSYEYTICVAHSTPHSWGAWFTICGEDLRVSSELIFCEDEDNPIRACEYVRWNLFAACDAQGLYDGWFLLHLFDAIEW